MFNTELTIKNNGIDTITTFAVYSDLHGGMNCAQNYFYQRLTGFEILPGQTQTLKLKRAYEDGVNNNLCFQCMAPNSDLEVQTKDNSLCKTFTITGIKNETLTNLKVYPNPISDWIEIESKTNIELMISILDLSGKVLVNSKLFGSSKIDLTNFHKGFYILKINQSDKILETRKIIKI